MLDIINHDIVEDKIYIRYYNKTDIIPFNNHNIESLLHRYELMFEDYYLSLDYYSESISQKFKIELISILFPLLFLDIKTALTTDVIIICLCSGLIFKDLINKLLVKISLLYYTDIINVLNENITLISESMKKQGFDENKIIKLYNIIDDEEEKIDEEKQLILK
jgi:hypothetical protein